MDMYWAAPPISRTLAAAAFFLSVSCHTGMLSFGYVIFYLGQFLKFPPYVWTIVTSFLITGEGIGIILDTYFLYTYSSQLEIATPRVSGPGDYITYLLFVCSVILVGYTLFVAEVFLFTIDGGEMSIVHLLYLSPPHIPFHLLICPRGAMLPATAVPENEEDYPCTSTGPSFAKYIRASSRCRHGGKFL